MNRGTGEFEVGGERLLPFLVLAAFILFHIVNNWIWLSTNVVIVGWDRPRHLIESLRYNDILKTLNYPSFFEAFTLSGYYPPLFHLLIVAFYKLFGLSADVAAMVNSLYLAILLPSTYMIGRKVWGWKEGLLVNCRQIHEEHFLYLIYTDYPEIRLRELARNWTGRPVYPQLFELDYFALSTYHPAHRFNGESREVIDTILESPPPLFREAFQLAQEYSLSDGNVVHLYRRQYPRSQAYPAGDYLALGEALLERARAGDGLILDSSEEVNLLGPYYRGEATVYLLSEKRSSGEVKATLGRVMSDHGRVFAVFGEESTGFVEGWLNEQGYRAWEGWYGGTRLVVYRTSFGMEETELEPLRAKSGEGLYLLSYRLYDSEVEPGGIIRLTLRWQAKERIGQDYKVFVHLLDGEGRIVGQRDSEPVGGSRPTSGWRIGEEILDNYGIMLPKELPSGEYQLVVGMYDPTSGERLPIYEMDGKRLPGKRVLLGAVEVTR